MVVTRRKPKRSKRAPIPLCPAADQHLRQLLNARLTSSDAWSREVISWIDRGKVDVHVTDQGILMADFAKVEKALRKVGCYPSGGLLTVAWRCSKCRRWTPATGFQKRPEDGDTCEDCWIYEQPPHVVAQWPSSPSAHAIQQAQVRGAKIRFQTTKLGRPKGRTNSAW